MLSTCVAYLHSNSMSSLNLASTQADAQQTLKNVPGNKYRVGTSRIR